MNKRDAMINKIKKRITNLEDLRSVNIAVALAILAGTVLGGLGLGYLLSSVPKTMMIFLSLGALVETYPIIGISKINQEIERLEGDIEGVKNDPMYDEDKDVSYKKEMSSKPKYSYSYSNSNSYNKYMDVESKRKR